MKRKIKMKKLILISYMLLLAVIVNAQQTDLPKLTGPYFGQKPPGMTPEIFAPGVVSLKDHIEMGCTWSPDLKEFYFARSETSEVSSNWAIWQCREEDGVWTDPRVVSFSGVYRDFYPFIPPDGQRLIFIRRDNKENKTRMGSWIVDRKGSSWSEPRFFLDAYCLTTHDFRTFYFSTEGTERDIGQLAFDNGVFSDPVRLPGQLNTAEWEAHGIISPDGSYMLFDRTKSTFVSFLRDDGTWSRGYNLGRKCFVPAISPDGKYIFFESGGDIYWVDAKIIEKFRIHETQRDDFPVLKGPYLGQKPPEVAPEIFAPGILSRYSMLHGKLVFSPDGLEAFWTCNAAPAQSRWTARQTPRGIWAAPEPSFFSVEYVENSMAYSADGKRLYFHSRRPLQGTGAPKDKDIWCREKTTKGWGEPVPLGPPVNIPTSDESAPSLASDGTLFFSRQEFIGGHGAPGHGTAQIDIYYSEWKNGTNAEPVRMGPEINSEYPEIDPVIAPDKSYLLFTSARPDGYSRMMNLYVSFRTEDGSWTLAQCLSQTLKIDNIWFPSLSADGAYLFFCGGYPTDKGYTDSRYYWISTKVIDELRPKK